MITGTLFSLPTAVTPFEEVITVLAKHKGVRIERILSTGQASPPDFWYDQDEDEWVALLTGGAGVLFADEAEPRTLVPGDWLWIPAHRRHRVTWTANHTIWLAVFMP